MTRSRKPKNPKRQINRKHRRIEPTAILIVAEGRKTEKDYFDQLVRKLKAVADIEGARNDDSAPSSVVKRAENAIKRDNSEYEVIYCVFDRDSHADYDAAIKMIDQLNRSYAGIEISAIPSVPCIEYWFYLHSKYSDRPYQKIGSPAADLLRDLQKISEFKDYNKSISKELFDYLFENQHKAKKNAIRSLEEGRKREDGEYHENPSTRVHLVLEGLERNISSKRYRSGLK